MGQDVVVEIHLGVEADDELRAKMETRCRALGDEFHEVTHVEVKLEPSGGGCTASGRVLGKGTELAGHGAASEPVVAVDRALDTLRQQLRRAHDKRIFKERREAQRHNPKRS